MNLQEQDSSYSCCTNGSNNKKLQIQDTFDGDLTAFSGLSMKERDLALEELHGVAGEIEETPEMVSRALIDMRHELSKVSSKKRKFIDRAIFLCPSLANDDKLLLKFLRGERFDAKEAAQKMCIHYDNKAELFPVHKLPCPITLDDMDEDDMACFRNGNFQPLRYKDQAGRTVNVLNFAKVNYKHWKNEARYYWYQVQAMLEDEATQTKGVVDVLVLSGMTLSSQCFGLIRDAAHILTNFCVRRVALHCCYDDPRMHPVFKFLSTVVPKEAQARQRFYFGSQLECHYGLRAYGIRMGLLPENDKLGTAPSVERYLEERREIEAQRRKMEDAECQKCIKYPKAMDILVGRGKPYQEFTGNLRLAAVVAAYTEQYKSMDDRMDKTVLSMQIVQKVQEEGSRFLQRTSEGWEVVDDTIAREKVVQALRVRAKKLREDASGEKTAKRMRNEPQDDYEPLNAFGTNW